MLSYLQKHLFYKIFLILVETEDIVHSTYNFYLMYT